MDQIIGACGQCGRPVFGQTDGDPPIAISFLCDCPNKELIVTEGMEHLLHKYQLGIGRPK